MQQNKTPPSYGFMPQPNAPPPSYEQAMGVGPIPGQAHFVPTHTVPVYNPPGAGATPVVTQQIVTQVVTIGPHSTHMICPSCHADINSKTRSNPGLIAWVSGFLIALFGCWFGCCLIPCCIDECMDTHHYCPNCNAYLGRHGRV
ncbi:lipopolysaccharide-induced tumor necrosis factor-alpha factor homolog [Culicoides brevitarsis]|uniref:lipopolysaccharide-induced tumor necrosis factor-alpha factor homolog n=1 Tax=Culicoides brevitarsis TaxID=469753 RepID=UPI00307B6313